MKGNKEKVIFSLFLIAHLLLLHLFHFFHFPFIFLFPLPSFLFPIVLPLLLSFHFGSFYFFHFISLPFYFFIPFFYFIPFLFLFISFVPFTTLSFLSFHLCFFHLLNSLIVSFV